MKRGRKPTGLPNNMVCTSCGKITRVHPQQLIKKLDEFQGPLPVRLLSLMNSFKCPACRKAEERLQILQNFPWYRRFFDTTSTSKAFK